MGSEASNAQTRAAVGAAEDSPTIGPEKLPTNELFEGAGSAGNVFGDKSMRRTPSEGETLAYGLAERVVFHEADPDELGQGRDDANGKPMGPQKGKVPDLGTSGKFVWG